MHPWILKKAEAQNLVTELKRKDVLDRLFREWQEFNEGTDPIWYHVLRIYHGKA